MDFKNVPAVQLFVGSKPHIDQILQHTIRSFLCKNTEKTCTCISCKQLAARQHHAVRWYAPEKHYYTVAQLEPIFEEVCFKRSMHDPLIQIIENAEMLSGTCANSLLKTLEEPPLGYYFILTTEYPALVLPTIYSRCVVQEFEKDAAVSHAQTFLGYFKNPSKMHLYECMKEFDRAKITEKETRVLIDELIHYYAHIQQESLKNGDEYAFKKQSVHLDVFMQGLVQLPMPGSAKLFWKTIYTSLI